MPRASSVKTAQAARRMLYCAVGAALLSIPTLAVADETFGLQAVVTIPGVDLASFDISWVDPTLHRYFLADRSNASIDIINTKSKHVTQIIPTGPNAFVGDTGVSDTSGPNGILTIRSQHDGDHDTDDGGRAQIWAGDGNSTVKIIDFPSGNVANVVNTGGTQRADELCYDPRDNLVMIANDATPDLFVTFISTEGHNPILGTISFKTPSAQNGGNQATNGIEQCQWNPRNGKIYLSLPGTQNSLTGGAVVVIDPVHRVVVQTFNAPDNCAPAGMAIGPDHQILLGCGGPDALVMSDTGTFTTVSGQGGNDEVWFNPGDGHYFLAESNNTVQRQLGIVDSRGLTTDQDIKTGPSDHSVAADPLANQAYVPIKCSGGPGDGHTVCTPAGTTTICSSGGGDDTKGCVAIYGPSGRDDRMVSRDHDRDHD